jgi:hypothetical protein
VQSKSSEFHILGILYREEGKPRTEDAQSKSMHELGKEHCNNGKRIAGMGNRNLETELKDSWILKIEAKRL